MINVYMGVMGSGKDFNATTHMNQSKAKVKIKVAFADAVRDMVWTLLNWEPKTPIEYSKFKTDGKITLSTIDKHTLSTVSGREFMQKLGTDAVRKYMPDFWVEIVRNKITDIIKECNLNREECDIYITDCRFENELTMLLDFDVRIIFCNFKSPDYRISDHESEKLANDLLKEGFEDLEDITDFIREKYAK
jgi:hypothetical protein